MKVLFAGPSLHGAIEAGRLERAPQIRCPGPAQQGDLARAVRHGASAIGLVDGLYENVASTWHKDSYLVRIDGTRVHMDAVEYGGMLTVFPEGDAGGALSQTMLIRQLPPAGEVNIVTKPGRETWGPLGYLAFSKVCTHAGCPVGLYQEVTHQLLCPCHQSLFDVGPGKDAIPVFGPAPRPLPQLPLYIDPAGYLRAQAPYDQPVGPSFWWRRD